MKELLKYIPFQLLFFLILGIILASEIATFNFPTVITILFLLLLLLFFLKNKKKQIFFTITTWFIFIIIGITAYVVTDEKNSKNHYTKGALKNNENKTVIILREVLKSTKNYNRYVGSLRILNLKKATGTIILNVNKKDSLAFKQGEKLFVNTVFYPISEPKNPYQFNYKKYLKNKQIYHQLYPSKDELVKLKSNSFSVVKEIGKIHEKITVSFSEKGFNKEELSIASALLLGEKQDISDKVKANFTNAGAVHILAISGLHIGILMLLLRWFFSPIRRFKGGEKISLVLVVFVLWAYAVFVGLSPSVVRAVTMFTAVAIGMFINRKFSVYQSLLTAGFILLLFNPRYLFEVGFQLSFLAVFFIVWLQPLLYGKIELNNFFLRKIWQLITVSLAAQIGVLPLTLYYFHQSSGLFLITNLLIIPVLGVILFLGFLSMILAIFDVFPDFIAYVFKKTIYYLNEVTSWIASYEKFVFSDIYITAFQLILMYAFIFLLTFWVKSRSYILLVFSLIVVFVFQVNNVVLKYNLETSSEWIVFDSYKNSLIGERIGKKMKIYTNDFNKVNPVVSYKREKLIKDTLHLKPKLVYLYKDKIILVVNENSNYNYSISPNILLLQNSPKINLERLLLTLKPNIVIADGSNYNSYKATWNKVCKKEKTPFFDTSKKGAFIIK